MEREDERELEQGLDELPMVREERQPTFAAAAQQTDKIERYFYLAPANLRAVLGVCPLAGFT